MNVSCRFTGRLPMMAHAMGDAPFHSTSMTTSRRRMLSKGCYGKRVSSAERICSSSFSRSFLVGEMGTF